MPAEDTEDTLNLRRESVAAWCADLEAFGIDLFPRRGMAVMPAASGAGAQSMESAAAAVQPAIAADAALPAAAGIDSAAHLTAIAAEVAVCTRCRLAETRRCSVPGQGSPQARMLFVGEAPGAEEDRTGLAFVGEAGQLLTRMIAAMGLQREQVFIINVLKCRPPENREPAPDEVAACRPFLLRQIAALNPEVIVALGAHAARNLLERTGSLGSLRGRAHELGSARVVATYHPAFLLRSPDMKRDAWEDLKFALSLLHGAA